MHWHYFWSSSWSSLQPKQCVSHVIILLLITKSRRMKVTAHFRKKQRVMWYFYNWSLQAGLLLLITTSRSMKVMWYLCIIDHYKQEYESCGTPAKTVHPHCHPHWSTPHLQTQIEHLSDSEFIALHVMQRCRTQRKCNMSTFVVSLCCASMQPSLTKGIFWWIWFYIMSPPTKAAHMKSWTMQSMCVKSKICWQHKHEAGSEKLASQKLNNALADCSLRIAQQACQWQSAGQQL